jgi:hypothetical protein
VSLSGRHLIVVHVKLHPNYTKKGHQTYVVGVIFDLKLAVVAISLLVLFVSRSSTNSSPSAVNWRITYASFTVSRKMSNSLSFRVLAAHFLVFSILLTCACTGPRRLLHHAVSVTSATLASWYNYTSASSNNYKYHVNFLSFF